MVVLPPVTGRAAWVEESMLPSWVNVEIASAACIFDGFFKCHTGTDGDEVIIVAQEEHRWGRRGDIVQRRESFPEFYDSVMAISIDAVVDDRIEK